MKGPMGSEVGDTHLKPGGRIHPGWEEEEEEEEEEKDRVRRTEDGGWRTEFGGQGTVAGGRRT